MGVVIGKGLRIGATSVSIGVGQGLRVGPVIGDAPLVPPSNAVTFLTLPVTYLAVPITYAGA